MTNNDCYKSGRKHTVKGIMVHSTGANNPWLKRYIGPDDGILGMNTGNNHWNQSGLGVCVHAFIGKDRNGVVRTYQTLPWNIAGWHSGRSIKGSANYMGYVGFEICEDGLTDPIYFKQVYKEAVELCAYLCKQYNLNPQKNIICHSEGHKMGIASNHADVMHWFSRFGKNMDAFRLDVKNELNNRKDGGLDIMGLNLKPICRGKLLNTQTLECCSQPSNSARTGVILRKKHEPFNIYAKAKDEKGNEWYLVNVNPQCIQWVAASGVQLVL